MLNHDAQLHPHHIDEQRLYDFSEPVAKVTQNPHNPKIWGLQNMSHEKWVCTASDGTVREVEPGRNVPLVVGTKINFGKSEGEVRL
jgi:hypothetical protein